MNYPGLKMTIWLRSEERGPKLISITQWRYVNGHWIVEKREEIDFSIDEKLDRPIHFNHLLIPKD